MNFTVSKPIATVIIVLVVAAIIWLVDGLYGKEQVHMTRVGGTMNHCTCSQRLEK